VLAVDTVASHERLTFSDQAGHDSPVSTDTKSAGTYLLVRRSDSDAVALWRFHPELAEMVSPQPSCGDSCFDRNHQVLSIGRYLLEWGPLDKSTAEPSFPYRLLEFDPTRANPLEASAASIQDGSWTKKKFWFSRPDFGNPAGAKKAYESGDVLQLIPVGGFILNLIPAPGRGTYHLWNFDPNPLAPGTTDPIKTAYSPQGAFNSITSGHDLIPVNNYVIDRLPESGEFWLWSFDPQNENPLAGPAVQSGFWPDIDATHSLVALGDQILDWVPATGCYRLWHFNPKNPHVLEGPIREGRLPEAFGSTSTLLGIQALCPSPLSSPAVAEPASGSIDAMRSRIKHVVYLMLENRSFDHVCGWLYDQNAVDIKFIGGGEPVFDGASTEMHCKGTDADGNEVDVHLSLFQGGELSDEWSLDFLTVDPYHDYADVMHQYYYKNSKGYADGLTPDMQGFVWNNSSDSVMLCYGPKQLPVLNGLAERYAISDAWFSSMPGATDSNRAFAFSGSALGQLNNFQNGPQYANWPDSPHRQSIWKVLWVNGFTDWKIYNSILWMDYVHTYQLYLKGQIPSLDADPSTHVDSIDTFFAAAAAGTLPAFSFLEPVWIGSDGTTSYHPGPDVVPGERFLNKIFEALRSGPAWNDTLFVITFDEHGGIYDHVPPPQAENPWPNDCIDDYRFDRLGVRVPTILVSPWIEPRTVFRSATSTPLDGTSFMATLLEWCGIPRASWWLGERVNHAPTFAHVFTRATPRTDQSSFVPPHDKDFPSTGGSIPSMQLNDLHRLIAPRIVHAITDGKLTAQEAAAEADHILENAHDLQGLERQLNELKERMAAIV
jgi:phospholipase C